jgi:cobalamin biosynthetic protein CobC
MASNKSDKSVVKGVMAARVGLPPLMHGGDLGAARKLFPGASEPFLDLSTGINPNPYPLPALPADAFTKLPEPTELARLTELAGEAYGAPSPAHVVAAPGSQVLVTLAAGMLLPGRALVLGPTYAEHARAACLAEHDVQEAASLDQLAECDLAIMVNPNNPDGRLLTRDKLLVVAERVKLLVVDEAFMEVGTGEESLTAEVERGNIVVLRSFGKFFGLPGVRLSFALTSPAIAARLAASLGPWPVSGVALAIGAQALADRTWIEATRRALAKSAGKLDALLAEASLDAIGGTSLFRLVETKNAEALFNHLGRAGILVRRFEDHAPWLRFGLPGSEQDWQRLGAALAAFNNRS